MRKNARKYGLLILLVFSQLIGNLNFSFGAIRSEQVSYLFSQPAFLPLHTASKEFYLSDDEKLTVALINLARFSPRTFIQEIILKSDFDTNQTEMASLLSRLKSQKSTYPLMPAFSLFKSALVHSKEMGKLGGSGHKGTDGKTYKERIGQYFSAPTLFEENYYQGSGEPVDVVIQMLLGQGEYGPKYRDNLLSNELHYIGISIQPHRTKCTNVVLDFAQRPTIASNTGNRKREKTEVYWRDCPTGTKVDSPKKSGGFSFGSLFGSRHK